MEQQTNRNDVTPSSSSSSKTVRIKYTINKTGVKEKDCELLVIACDPRNLRHICDYTPQELAIFDKLINFTFHTSLIKVKCEKGNTRKKYPGVYGPQRLKKMDGSVYAYRNESAKQFGVDGANKMDYNLVTVYQLQGDKKPPLSDSDFQAKLREQLQPSDWWPFSNELEILNTLTTPYFDHFSKDDLKNGLPWKLLNLQGQNNTLYVHGFTCFESALHCWDYAKLMLNYIGSEKQPLPTKKDAPIVILGAGVSGLLFAVRLKRLGYKNIEILESTNRYGGKTQTIIKDEPYPESDKQKTVCELGTCYLSPAYYHMIKDLEKFFVGNNQIDFAKGDPDFRGIITEGDFQPGFPEVPSIVSQKMYIVLKAKDKVPELKDAEPLVVQQRIALDLAKYSTLHWKIMSSQTPMPLEPPTELLEQTFTEFLTNNNLLSLVGMLNYMYAVQGYGVMDTIPAYYGLMWITPIVIQTILLDEMDPENIPVVTALEKGWIDVWDQIVKKENLSITYLAETKSITRLGKRI